MQYGDIRIQDVCACGVRAQICVIIFYYQFYIIDEDVLLSVLYCLILIRLYFRVRVAREGTCVCVIVCVFPNRGHS